MARIASLQLRPKTSVIAIATALPEQEYTPSTSKKYVFDSESDGLALEATRLWITCVEDYETGETWEYEENDDGWMTKLDEATHLIGHNIVGHDFPLFEKLTGWKPKSHQMIQDTLIMSLYLDYNRFPSKKHGMAEWGKQLGQEKQEHEEWHVFSEEMRSRCRSDVKLNCVMYRTLIDEFNRKKNNDVLGLALLCENAAGEWVAKSRMNGWPFNKPAAESLREELEVVAARIKDDLEPKLGYKAVAIDKVKNEVDVKRAKWTAQGCYHSHTASWFDVNPWSGFETEVRNVIGEYCRLDVVPLKLGSDTDVKIFLYRQGWVPFEYNTKWNPSTRKKERTSPKVTEDSLEFLGGDGKLFHEYSVTISRLGILKGWIENTDENGDLHGDCFPIGTPSMRARHKIIVNVPALESKWGPEMRSLFIHKPGFKLIGADSAGNQGRGLAHYLGNAEYTHILINDDIHTYNANKLDAVLKGMDVNWSDYFAKNILKTKGHLRRFLERRGISDYNYFISGRKSTKKLIAKQKRARAKRVYYAFLFGAAGAKLWGYCFGTPDDKRGAALKTGFINAVPGFKSLTDRLKHNFNAKKKKNGWEKAYILSLSGNRIYVDSTHKLLVYLLQAFEKVTCAAAIMLLMQYFEDEQIEYYPHMFMHDEVDFSVREKDVKRAKELAELAFKEGPKLFGVNIMAGGANDGDNWKDIH